MNLTLEALSIMADTLLSINNFNDKIEYLLQSPEVIKFLKQASPIVSFLDSAPKDMQVALLSVIAIGEGPIVFKGWDRTTHLVDKLSKLASILIPVEKFYEPIGGIVGYHHAFLQLIQKKNGSPSAQSYKMPPGTDISNEENVLTMIRWGIESLPSLAEIYPVGGAGDRLNLKNEKTGEPLPAGELKFLGRTLIEGLVLDVEAREYLYKQLTGKEIVIPIVFMTSHEKDNDRRIKKILKDNHWFGRNEKSYFFIEQPLVPVITVDGHWSMKGTFEPYLKPGGHGAIWKLALDQGAFDWLLGMKKTKAVVRQINNPIAGTDYGLIAFSGIGCKQDKIFGFASCSRIVNAAEGMNVLIETVCNQKFHYTISNVEYTDFAHKGIQDLPVSKESPYSKYPANTNLLFIDIKKMKELALKDPVPGMVINLKNKAPFISSIGEHTEVHAGRLESTMQNISDTIAIELDHPASESDFAAFPVYLTYNERRKTISVTKRAFDPAKSLIETPEGCLYEILLNAEILLRDICKMNIPRLSSEVSYLKSGPNWLFLYRPSLGPLYSIIGQKIRKGKINEGSELQIDLSQVDIEELNLSGSLLITGDMDSRCTLKKVEIENEGIDQSAANIFWKNEIVRKEALKLILGRNSEFFAEEILFFGSMEIHIPPGERWTAKNNNGKIEFEKEKINKKSWSWNYSFDSKDRIQLQKKIY